MSTGTFAHKLLALFGIVAALLALGVAIYTGLAGPIAQGVLQTGVSMAMAFYWTNAGPINLLWQVLGALGTAIYAVFQITKAWHYAELNLPHRLADLLGRGFSDQQGLRAEYVGANLSPEFDRLLKPAEPKDGWGQSVARSLGLMPLTPEQKLRSNLKVASAEVELVKAKLEEYKHRYASALIVSGIDVARGEEPPNEGDKDAGTPLYHFQAALEVRPDDLDALEFTIKQLLLLNGAGSEIEKQLKRLAEAAENQGQPLRHARCLRYHAHHLFTQTRDNRDGPLVEGRNQLNSAKGIAEHAIAETELARSAELAQNRELFARIQVRREKFTAASIALGEASNHYKKLPEPAGSAGQNRVDGINEELQAKKRDGEGEGN